MKTLRTIERLSIKAEQKFYLRTKRELILELAEELWEQRTTNTMWGWYDYAVWAARYKFDLATGRLSDEEVLDILR